jgi:hypothetical protein
LLASVAAAQEPYPTAPVPIDALPPTMPTATQQQDIQKDQPDAMRQRGEDLPPEEQLLLEHPPVKIELEPPGLERLAQSVQSDAQLKERIRQENRDGKSPLRIVFPSDPVLSYDTYSGRKWNPTRLEVAPYYVCHGRLYFQQINSERYGWDLGVLHPVISGMVFLWDFVTFPYQLAKEPCRCIEYNTGWCLPGDPVPLLLYPLQTSVTGTVAEIGTILTLVAVFP